MKEKLNEILAIFDIETQTQLENVFAFLERYDEQNTLLERGLEVAKIVLPLKPDKNIIVCCFLIEFLRQNKIDNFDLLKDYAESIELANQVVKISNFDYSNLEKEMDNIRAMLIAIAKDIRVMIIRLCEVLYLARRTKDLTEEQAKALHYDIRDIYSPIAARLGLSFFKNELNDLNLAYFHPQEYKKLMKDIAETTRSGAGKIDAICNKVKEILKSINIKGDCFGRVKHISSIYNKLTDKSKTLSQIFDLYAIRVLVENKNECYAVLGAIHTEFTALDGRFKDYITRPKENGYQSLHTVILLDDEPYEIQIRTFDMNEHAEYGVAAHFLYKEHKNKLDSTDDKLLWIRKIIENKDESTSDILESLKTDVYLGEIFVQTPMGKVIKLIEGSTPIDFAYAIHSGVGNKCVGAYVNGKMVPLNSTLNNGDIVEIITNQNAKGPSKDWLNIAKTSQARNKINQFFRHEMRDENIKKGKAILEQSAKNKGYALSKLLEGKWVNGVIQKLAFNELDEMYAAVGYGSLTSVQVINKLVQEYDKENKEETHELKVYKENINHKETDIEGLSGIMVKYAKCCNPIPGDEIIGFVSRGSGVTIHRKDCKAFNAMETDRAMDCKWNENRNQEQNYIASLKILVENKTGVLATISTKIAENKINITKISNVNAPNNESIINVSFYIKNKKELDEFINKLKALSIVRDVIRGGK